MNGIIILNYNSWKITSELAKKLALTAIINKIIIVDNKSSDDSYANLLQLESEKIHIIESDNNKGYSSGNNIGIKYLISNYKDIENIFICNPDVLVEEDCLIKMVHCLGRYPEYGMVGAVRTDINGNYSQRQFWDLPDFKTELLECFAVTRLLRKRKQTYQFSESLSGVFEVDVLPGSFWGARAEVLKRIDYLDEGTFLYYEENIISKRIHRNGYKLGIVLSAKYIHNHIHKKSSTFYALYNPFLNMQKSRKYYQDKYLNLNSVQKVILSICMKLQNIEMFCICCLKLIRNKVALHWRKEK